jgi:hypothetical protein
VDTLPLLKSQKNEVLRLIETAVLDPLLFKWEERDSMTTKGTVTLLRYGDTEFFLFDLTEGEKHCAIFLLEGPKMSTSLFLGVGNVRKPMSECGSTT